MNKFLRFAVATALVFNIASVAVLADETVKGTDNGENIYVEYGSTDCEWAMVNGYADGKLAMSYKSEKSENGFVFDLPEVDEAIQMRIVYSDGNVYPFSVEKEEALPTEDPVQSPLPEQGEDVTETPAPEASEEPTEAPSPQETKKPETTASKYPAVYEKPLDALHAPAVVKDVQLTVLDGETYYIMAMLYAGDEITVKVREDIVINSAPAKWSELEGEELSNLKTGDVIHFLCNVMGNVKTVDLMYRPEFESHITEGDNFSELYNNDGYSTYYFGVPVGGAKGYLLLAGANGKTKEIELDPAVFVYTVERGGKKALCELSGKGFNVISRTTVPKSSIDDDGNITSWEDVDDETYALVRVVKGEATDIVVFER